MSNLRQLSVNSARPLLKSLSKSYKRFTPKDLGRKEGRRREEREKRRRRKEQPTSRNKVGWFGGDLP